MPRRKRGMTDAELKEWLETQYDVNDNGCWVWRGGKGNSYAFTGYKGRVLLVHRLYWLLSGRTIPEGLGLLHGKDCSKACYNPEHLHPGNQTENGLDRHRDGTMAHAKLTPEKVLEIRARTDKSHRGLAAEYGVNRGTISDVIGRKSWSWI